jgi:riboflavin kinase/FMN adenylyltransferase
VREATELLGFPWFVSGTVIHGDKRGRELGFPTANLRLDAGCGLRHGIYAVRAAIDGRRYDGVASFGRRPMFDSGAVLLEVYLFDFSGDLYGRSIDVAFIDWIRDEAVFASVEELTRQMQDDARRAREALARAGDVFPPI